MNEQLIPVLVVVFYLGVLLMLGLASNLAFRGTSKDYFVVSHSIGPFLLLMSIFGTTMTSFAMVGSTAKAYTTGIGVYGMMASWSGLIHSAIFFLVGIKLWAMGKRLGFVTQVQFFRERFESPSLGYILFPVLVLLVIPYLLIGLIGAGRVMLPITAGAFPDLFPHANPALHGGIPPWLTSIVISAIVLTYVFFGGLRGAVWANTFQTCVFMAVGLIAFLLIGNKLGGLSAATKQVLASSPERLAYKGNIGHLQFLTYALVPLSVGMFPHIFQHWLTARNAKAFRLPVVAHPIFIMIVWAPCILIGIWAAGMGIQAEPNAVLGRVVAQLVKSPLLGGLVGAGILAAIMSSLDSQFMALGTMFTHDVVIHHYGRDRVSERQQIWLARSFIVLIVAITYVLSLFPPRHIFDLGVWCFSGFAGLFPLVFAAVYWKRVTRAGAIASILATVVLTGALFARDVLTTDRLAGEEALIFGMMPVAVIVAGSLLSLIVVSLVTKPPAHRTVERFFPSVLEGVPV